MKQHALELRGLSKYFGAVPAVNDIDLLVEKGEFVTLLGPSGSGKTTTLRMIAGFSNPSTGSVTVDGIDITRVPPYRRDVGMVFQNYALFPHMTVLENVAFPLKMRKVKGEELSQRVEDALALVELSGYGERYPRQLSGGQQQRVALARAVVARPRLLLMDEPLGALDKRLREALQVEILRISKQLEATVIYVTHDQEEALAMSDRIAVFNEGQIAQLGSGQELYRNPASLFVADFLGESNIFRGRCTVSDGASRFEFAGRQLRLPTSARGVGDGPYALVVRPEDLLVMNGDGEVHETHNCLDATVEQVLYLGPTWRVDLQLEGGQHVVLRTGTDLAHGDPAKVPSPGAKAKVGWRIEKAIGVPDGT